VGIVPRVGRLTVGMSRKSAPTHPGSLSKLAERQHGVVAAGQLYSLGLSESQVRSRVTSGWLHRVHHGVYAVGHRRITPEGRWMAAVLAGGPGAVLSHADAAALWSIRPQPRSERVDVTLRTRAGRRGRTGLRVHRPRRLPDDELSICNEIPCTTPARTILDIAGVVNARLLERALDEADRLRLLDPHDPIELLRRHRGHPGARRLRSVIARHRIGSTWTRSELEERFLALCRKHRLPQPAVNVALLDYVVDFLWAEAALVVEVDGHASHGTRRAFQADRDRDGRLTVAGYAVVRFTWSDVIGRPAIVADRVRRLLAGRKTAT
jgi:very-short-patch-repair endonuclease/predicted transcriptional regulator of viral defense system